MLQNEYLWSKGLSALPKDTPMKNDGIDPLPDDKILDWSKLKRIADDILKCI